MNEATSGFAAAAPVVAHVFVERPEVLCDDQPFWIEGEDGHHLRRVRRLRVGEEVTASDGRGAWRVYAVAELGDRRVRLTPTGVIMREPALCPRLAVAFAPAKGDTAPTLVHQLTELGVDRIVPVETLRSVVRWDRERAGRAVARLRRVAREAAMQARRAYLPEVVPPGPLADLAGHPALVVADRDGAPAGSVPVPTGGEWLVLVGPEGGLDPSEMAPFGACTRLAVGPYVLRAVTAPVAAAAALAGLRQPSAPGPGP